MDWAFEYGTTLVVTRNKIGNAILIFLNHPKMAPFSVW
jgi:hypothetical protein